MKKTKTIYYKHCRTIGKLIFTFLCMSLLACSVEERIYNQDEAESETEVTFSLQVPGGNTSTRALDYEGEEETHIEAIDVLIFGPNGGNYIYRARGYNIDTDQDDRNKKNFTVTLTTGTFDLVVLANCKDILDTLDGNGDFSENFTRQQMEEALTCTLAGKWNTNAGSSGYIHIPMFGEKKNVQIDQNTSLTGSNSIFLARMVARIDVSLSDNAATDFKLKSVHLYNRNTKAYLMPATGNWDLISYIVTAPSVPAVTNIKVTGPLEYTEANGEVVDEIKCLGEIYTFEAMAGSRNDYLDNTCLVIGGIYEGKMNYYRADFTQVQNNTTTWLPVLRNHRYNVSVQSVNGPGFGSSEDAYKSLPENIDISIVKWNESNLSNVNFNNQYYLSLSTLDMGFSGLGGIDDLKIETNCADWKFLLTTDPDPEATSPAVPSWVSITSSHTAGTTYNTSVDQIGLSVTPIPDTNNRTAYLHVFAGRFIMTVTIVQQPWFISRAVVTPDAVVASSGGEIYTVTIDGYFDEIPIRLRTTQGEIIEEVVIGTEGVSITNGSNTLELPAYWFTQAANKQLIVEYYNKMEDRWIQLLAPNQQAYWLRMSTSDPDLEDFTGWGSYMDVKVEGNFPALPIRFANTTGTAAIESAHPPIPAGAPGTYKVYVPYNDEGIPDYRTIQFQYWDGTKNQAGETAWTSVFSVRQRQGNIVLPEYSWPAIDYSTLQPAGYSLGISPARNRVLAHQDYDHWKGENGIIKNWYQAMGIREPDGMDTKNTTQNTVGRVIGNAADKYLNSNYELEVPTGCGAYLERDFGEMNWMLPTILEVNQIKYMHYLLQRPAGFSTVEDPNNGSYSSLYTSTELSEYYYFDDFGWDSWTGYAVYGSIYPNLYSDIYDVVSPGPQKTADVVHSTSIINMVNYGVGPYLSVNDYFMYYYRKNGSQALVSSPQKYYLHINTRCVRQWNPSTDIGGPGYVPLFNW
ncbi:MAG: fimbrial protein [Tannerellaceae bacterium]|nr:fimbrial protein [Tannerellaceae bacterium]